MNRIGLELKVDHLKEIAPHFHMEVELIFVLSGEADLSLGDDTYHMTKDSVIVVNSEKKHSLAVKEPGLCCRIAIDYQAISDYLGSSLFLFWCNSVAERQREYDRLLELLRKILATQLVHGGREDFGTYALYFQLMDFLIKHYLIDSNDVRYQENRDEVSERIHQIMSYVQGNYNREITLNELAEKLYLSNAYLSRFFKKNLGQNFKDYINGIRLHHALDELLQTDKNMTRIAMDNGFPSVSRFNQVFREIYGMSPLAYREKHVGERDAAGQQPEGNPELLEELQDYIRREQPADDVEGERTHVQIVDVTNYRYAHKNWNRAINIGPLSDLMQAQVQRDIQMIHEGLGFTYVRFWNLFDDFICEEGQKYNFDRIDRSIEFLIANHMKPFLVLGGKERDIMKYFGNNVYKEQVRETNFLNKPQVWNSLMKQFCSHLLEHFGREEVSTWVFELRKPKHWDIYYNERTEEEFKEWFAIAVRMLKKYYPQMLVGGCEFTSTWDRKAEEEIAKVCAFWKEIGYEPDFVSIAVYPYEGFVPSMNEEYLREDLLAARRLFQKYGLGHVPIMATEWSNTLSNRNIYNESCYKGAYIIQNLTMNMDIADKIIYWNGSDIFGEFADTADILYGGVGLVNKNGLPKPSFFAFWFLKDLYKYQICCTRNYCLTTDGNHNYRLLCNNMKHLTYNYCAGHEETYRVGPMEYEQYFEDSGALTLKLQLKGIAAGEYELRSRMVSREYGSILDELISWDCAPSLKREDLEYLKQTCRPKLTLSRLVCREGKMNLDITLDANAFELIEIHYQIDEALD